MRRIGQARELKSSGRKASVAIGMFDGVHLGHQQVIKQAIYDARQHRGISLAVTFDVHPATVVAPERAPLLIYPLERKLQAIEALGIDAILVIHFDREFSARPGEAFVRELAEDLGQIYSVCVGSAFAFGHKRSGNVALLEKLGREMGFQVHGLAAVGLAGEVVSSTRIRQRIAAGDFDAASQMLGRAYSITGRVLHGDGLGRKLGVPTANIDIRGILTPPRGVYAANVRTAAGTYPGVANVGVRPTVGGFSEPGLEAHLLDFDGDLYGQQAELFFGEFLRGEQKFENLAALQGQIQSDIAKARSML